MSTETVPAFSFGQNWKAFLDEALDSDRIQQATIGTRELLRLESLAGLTFADVGCGSGLFSYVAHSLGAERIVSFDLDPISVECCRQIRATVGDPINWKVQQGSVLDQQFLEKLGTFDVVYSWGVLHHTGNMWQAVRNAATLVRPEGKFALAIYNRLEYNTLQRWRGSHKWLRIKKLYNSSGNSIRRVMELSLAAKDVAAMLVRLRNPVTEVNAYRNNRGMSWWHDIRDWLGGYPYEFASAGEVFTFCHDELGMTLLRLQSTSSIGCHEFLFQAGAPPLRAIGGRELES
jgi:2-polyprenyl-3-methyl-5-hydroxy-6-metoxy-1,4-benzoquinol methylase